MKSWEFKGRICYYEQDDPRHLKSMQTELSYFLLNYRCGRYLCGPDIDFQIEPMQSSPSLYYQPVGMARLYSTEWRVATYLSLQRESNNVDAVRKHIEFTVAFCVRHSHFWQSNAMVCDSMLDVVHKDYERVQEMRELVLQLIRTEWGIHRQKRGIFNIVGRVTHSLFEMLDSDSEAFYNHKISQLEEDQLD